MSSAVIRVTRPPRRVVEGVAAPTPRNDTDTHRTRIDETHSEDRSDPPLHYPGLLVLVLPAVRHDGALQRSGSPFANRKRRHGIRGAHGTRQLGGSDTAFCEVSRELVQDLSRVADEASRADLHGGGAREHELGHVHPARHPPAPHNRHFHHAGYVVDGPQGDGLYCGPREAAPYEQLPRPGVYRER